MATFLITLIALTVWQKNTNHLPNLQRQDVQGR